AQCGRDKAASALRVAATAASWSAVFTDCKRPTSRSVSIGERTSKVAAASRGLPPTNIGRSPPSAGRTRASAASKRSCISGGGSNMVRSEEHTSELQSRENLVCRLLLEKKKN